ncbi:MAG: TVP38/TMEM64 family protein [Granulosicoccus sp.]
MSFTKSLRAHRVAIVLLAILLLILIVTFLYPPSEWIPARQWAQMLEHQGPKGMLLFALLGALATAVGLPRQLVAFIAGLAYGVVVGLILSLVAAILGCFLTVQTSKRFLAKIVVSQYPVFIGKLDRLLEEDVFAKILILRLQPLGTNLLTNVCVGFTAIPIRLFLAASALGYVPQMLVFALLGSGVRVGSQTQMMLSVTLLLISIVLGLFVYKRHVSRL